MKDWKLQLVLPLYTNLHPQPPLHYGREVYSCSQVAVQQFHSLVMTSLKTAAVAQCPSSVLSCSWGRDKAQLLLDPILSAC